jgi:hypothetical protein
MGSMKPDMEEIMKGIPMVISNLPFLYYETLLSLGKKSQRSFSVSPFSDQFQRWRDGAIDDPIQGKSQTPFSIDSTFLKTSVGSQSFSKWS